MPNWRHIYRLGEYGMDPCGPQPDGTIVPCGPDPGMATEQGDVPIDGVTPVYSGPPPGYERRVEFYLPPDPAQSGWRRFSHWLGEPAYPGWPSNGAAIGGAAFLALLFSMMGSGGRRRR